VDDTICEMAGCEVEMESAFGDMSLYGGNIGRYLHICFDCHDEFENAMAYGHPDMANTWLIETQKELTEKNPFDTTGGI